jgi:lysozyme family protein
MIDTRFLKEPERIKLLAEMGTSKEFQNFFEWLMDREGRVVHNDPRDPGGHTAWGISRRYHPNCPIWKLVDAGRVDRVTLEPLVKTFYIQFLFRWWYLFNGPLRAVFCDSVVNMGLGRVGDKNLDAGELLQMSMNCLAQKNYLKVDGDIGNITVAALKTENHTAIAYTMIALRLIEYRKRGSGSMAWAREGWLNRVQLLETFISKF